VTTIDLQGLGKIKVKDKRFYVPDNSDGYFHVYNRGVDKRVIFTDRQDFLRFEETISYYIKGPHELSLAQQKDHPDLDLEGLDKHLSQRVEVLAYCLMQNHYHLLLKSISHNGISKFMSDISNSYTRYFNTKHDRSGHLFQGRYQKKQIPDDPSLFQVSRYIHLNPTIDPFKYRYSSLSFWIDRTTPTNILSRTEVNRWINTMGGVNSYSSFINAKTQMSSCDGIEDLLFS